MLPKVVDIREGLLKKLNREFSQVLEEVSETAEALEDDPDDEELRDRHNKAFDRSNELETQIAVLEQELFGVEDSKANKKKLKVIKGKG